jgi:hypothetical protein
VVRKHFNLMELVERMEPLRIAFTRLCRDNHEQNPPPLSAIIAIVQLLNDFPRLMPTQTEFRTYVLVRYHRP